MRKCALCMLCARFLAFWFCVGTHLLDCELRALRTLAQFGCDGSCSRLKLTQQRPVVRLQLLQLLDGVALKRVVDFADELIVRIDVNMQEVQA